MDFSIVVKYLPVLAKGAITTVELTALAVIIGTFLGLVIAFASISKNLLIKGFARFYTWLVRGTPLLLQLFVIYYGLPQFGLTLSPFVAAVTGLSINSAAYIAEIIRAAIQSIEKGQMEAARSIGMSYFQAMRKVILPQATRRMIPPLGNEFIALLKDSSLVATIAMVDLMRTAQQMYATTFRPMEIFATAGFLYLMLTTFFTVTFSKVERRLAIYD